MQVLPPLVTNRQCGLPGGFLFQVQVYDSFPRPSGSAHRTPSAPVFTLRKWFGSENSAENPKPLGQHACASARFCVRSNSVHSMLC